MKETIKYTNPCGLDFKFTLEDDGWYSIYKWHYYKMEYVPLIQSKDLEHCYSYVDRIEPINVPIQKLV